MTPTVLPEGTRVRNAVKWISEQIQENPDRDIKINIREAAYKFDLSPKETEGLYHFYRDHAKE